MSATTDRGARTALLGCGIAASLVYVAADVLGSLRWEGYSPAAQAVSELSALGAPSRSLVVSLMIMHSVLALAFGVGVVASAGHHRALRVAGLLLIGIGVVDVVAPFFPMHRREADETFTDTMHIAVTGVTVLLIVAAIGFAAVAMGGPFRRYCVATILVLLVFGAVAGAQGGRLAAGGPTPWLGVCERVNIGGYLLWMAVFAVVLLRGADARTPRGSRALKTLGRRDL
ncbi:MAG: DUF998 domain-containing protein [Saccharothrix sp.]|nr:DUF998 domain-containing protein [Saccharothrix sp.]